MSAAAHSTSPPSTAAVLEYQCLFTHDLRRKQKRWQDGRLKFHTFNKRVMVYDERGNFIGDMHWRHDYAFDEGEEVELERGGIIVQVSCLVARGETDLSELLDKRAKEKEQRQIRQIARSPAATAVLQRTIPRPPALPSEQARATPASSVPVQRTPRLELGSGPLGQADRPSARGEADPVLLEKPIRSRHLNQKSGYAQGLFGQSLTLSHTPVSSVPPRRQPQHDSSSDSTSDKNEGKVQRNVQPPLPEHPKTSRHFNNPASRLQTVGPEKQANTDRNIRGVSNELVEGSVSRGMVEGDHTFPPDRRVEKHRHVALVEDVIEIDDSEPIPVRTLRKPRSQKGIKETGTINQQTVNTSKVTRPRQVLWHENLTASRQAEDEQESDTEKIDDPSSASRKSMTSRITTKKRETDPALPTNNQDMRRSFVTPRRPDEPVKELKIKSRKRGLLIISDAPKKPCRRTTVNPTGPSDKTEKLRSRNESNVYNLSRSPSPEVAANYHHELAPSSPVLSTDGVTEQGIGDVDGDPSESPMRSPMANHHGEWEMEDAGKDMESTRFQRTISTELGDFDDSFRSLSPVAQESSAPNGTASAKDRNSQREKSSFEDLQEDDKEPPPDYVDVVIGDDATVAQSTTQPPSPTHKSYDPYRMPSSPEEVTPFRPNSSPRPKSPPIDCSSEEAPAKDFPNVHRAMHKPNAARTNKQQRRSRRLIILEDDEEDNSLPGVPDQTAVSLYDTEDNATKLREAAPTLQNAKRTGVRKAKAQHDEACLESQDEHDGKRRRSTRQRRNRSDDLEEPYLASQQDFSGEEQVPKKRQCRISGAAEQRPRLERVKKNVKSRELIGFNLASLNAPLGPRGFGMPFSILHSPIDGLPERHTSDEAVPKALSVPDVDDGLHQASHIATRTHSEFLVPHRNIVNDCPSPILGGRPKTSTPSTTNLKNQVIEPAMDERHARAFRIATEPHHEPAQPFTVVPEVKVKLMEQEKIPANTTASCLANSSLSGSSPKADAPEPKESTVTVPSRDFGIAKDNGAIDLENPAARTQSLNPAGDIAPEEQSPRPASVSTEAAQTPSTRASTTTTLKPPLQASITDTGRLASTNEGAKIAQSRAERAPVIRADNVRKEGARDDSDAVEEDRAESTNGLVASFGVRVTAPFKKPMSTLRRQMSLAPTANDSHASLPGDVRDTAGGHRTRPSNASVGPSTIGADLQELKLPPVQADSVEILDTKEGSGAAKENPGSYQAPAGPIQKAKHIGLGRQVTAPRRVNNITAVIPQVSHPEDQTADSIAKAPARIINPASRGRKAALASDAVGQVPQRVLPPTQPALLVPISTADLACTPYEPPPKEPERPKKKMTFPGFQSARGGGPWSREAFDLLESGRPG
ncbi:hypothetical protein VPNG_07323 [Cytospora leucostoma]|uniref:5'-3' DNA helicase ZGRF1-like N-terminal domain-containing protein n=1 Tax=Cytospora leucostoma TaxID=1230097 RepID=A0A423WUD7_9PEZI|nr:hypothetical protein VPNG_07323 [Cytospora leucostoma]